MAPRTRQKPITNPGLTDLYPGLNEITDALEAFPCDLVGYFTLLKEIDAKCVYTVPYLSAYIKRFLQMKKTHPKRDQLLARIRELIRELMPCLEEKMHVATIASEIVDKHMSRINQSYEIVCQDEIPESVRVGPLHDPCMKPEELSEVYSRKSDSRDEVLATKRKEEEDRKDRRTRRHIDTAPPAPPKVDGRKKRTQEEPEHVVPKRRSKPKRERSTPYEYTPRVNGNATIADVATAMKPAPAPPRRVNSDGEPVYCYCNQVSYGEMVGCDGEDCEREWFHLPCTGLTELPKGAWYCDDCKAKMGMA